MVDDSPPLRFLRQYRAGSKYFEFPGPRDRVCIVGTTGEGKSTFAFWLFSESADFDRKPWIIVDYKGEAIADRMLSNKDAFILGVKDDIPTKPGIYVMKPEAATDQHAVIDFLWRVYRRGKCGLVFDEVSMVPEMRGEANSGGPLKSILTQGRSKEIPVYGLVQRPVDVNRHIYTEAQFISVFWLKSKKDFVLIKDVLPENDRIWTENHTMPRHYSRWYDDRRRLSFILKPCPPADHILDTIAHRVYDLRKRAAL